MAKKAKKVDKTEDDLQRDYWRSKGGDFHGPNVETGTMPEAKLLPLLRTLRKKVSVTWGPILPGSIRGKARILFIEGSPSGRYEDWEEDNSMSCVHKLLLMLSKLDAIEYTFTKDEWSVYG